MKPPDNHVPQQIADSKKQTAKSSSSIHFCYLLSVLCYLLSPNSLLAFNAHQPFDISSDVLEYNDDTQELTAEGHATVVQSSSTLTAQLIRYDKLHKRLV